MAPRWDTWLAIAVFTSLHCVPIDQIGSSFRIRTKEKPNFNPFILPRHIPVIRNPQRLHAPNPNRIKDRYWQQVRLRLRERLCHAIQMPTPRNVPRHLRQFIHLKSQLRMPHCVAVQTRLDLLRRRHPEVEKEVAMNCTREEHVQHLAGEVRAIGEEKVEV